MEFQKVMGVGLMLGVIGLMGCIEDPYPPPGGSGTPGEDGYWAPYSGNAPQAIVEENLGDLHLLGVPNESGIDREIITYQADSGQICMMIKGAERLQSGSPTPGEDASESPVASPSPTAQPREHWGIYSAQVSREYLPDGTMLLHGKILWDDDTLEWQEFGSYNFNSITGTMTVTSETWENEELRVTGETIDEVLSPRLDCSKLIPPDSIPIPTPTPPSTPWPEAPTPF